MEQTLLNKIMDLYNFSEIISNLKIDKGYLSENYKISTKDKSFFLKKYRFDDENRVKEVQAVKSYFSNGGIPVILPLKNNQKDRYFEYKNSYFAIFPFVEGFQPERGELSKQMIISLAETLGQMHLLGKGVDLEVGDSFKPWDKEEALKTIEAIAEKSNKK